MALGYSEAAIGKGDAANALEMRYSAWNVLMGRKKAAKLPLGFPQVI
jgi:hypothetical protein